MFLLFPIIYVSVDDGLFIIWYILWITFRSWYYIIQYQCFKIILKHRLTIFPLLSSGRMSTLFHNFSEIFSSFQSLSHVWLFVTPWSAAHQASHPSPTPGVYSNSCLSSWWCHPTILSSVIPFSCPQSFPASGSFQMSQLFLSGGQSIGVSASTSVLPMNTQGWSHLGWTGWISLQSKGLSRVFSNTTV